MVKEGGRVKKPALSPAQSARFLPSALLPSVFVRTTPNTVSPSRGIRDNIISTVVQTGGCNE